jgi:putative tryptophan/tyrosine transport system substrate-binding protein
MRRREFLVALGLFPAAAARAQGAPKRRIGFLGGSAAAQQWPVRLSAFRAALAGMGYVEGRNVSFEYRWAEGHNERLPALAAELVADNVDVIVVLAGTGSALAAKGATARIPIVFRIAGDPVEFGLVAHLNEPGGNATGITTIGAELGPKQLELLHELVPSSSVFAVLSNPTNPVAESASRHLAAAGTQLGVQLQFVRATVDADIEPAFAKARETGAGALLIGSDAFFNSRNERVAGLALKYALPTVSPYREFAEAGGLMSYGGSITEASGQAGVYTGRVLNGEAPGALPVIQPRTFELVLNLKTAKALGLTVRPTLLARADEVIE